MISRRILAAVALLCAFTAPAFAQKTKAQITTEIGTLFPDNTVGQITPLGLRTVALDTVNSIMPTAPVVSGNLACFSGTTGLLQDCGSAPTTVPLTVGITPIASGTTGRVLYDNAGFLGEYSNAQLTALINLATASVSGALPAWPNNTTTFLRGDGTYTAVGISALSGLGTGVGTALGIGTNLAGGFLVPSAALTANGVVYGGGSGVSPGSTAAGTNGQLFLGVTAGPPQWGTMSGDATIANTGALTLATVNSNVGSFGSATQCSAITVNAKGLITAASATTCTPAVGSITGLGTGVATALGVNVGSAGAFVTFNGALGTPTSGTATNLTGLPIAGITGLGTGVAAQLATAVSTAGGSTTTIASGATALGTGAISSATCATVVTATATNTATTDVLMASFNGDPTAVTGFVPSTAGMLTIFAYPTLNTANFKVCNNTTSSITPGAITVNWRVTR